jgi:hypothetical protein
MAAMSAATSADRLCLAALACCAGASAFCSPHWEPFWCHCGSHCWVTLCWHSQPPFLVRRGARRGTLRDYDCVLTRLSSQLSSCSTEQCQLGAFRLSSTPCWLQRAR